MANLSNSLYSDVGAIFKLANEANDDNWDGNADMKEQADRLADIATLAARAAKTAAAVDKALS